MADALPAEMLKDVQEIALEECIEISLELLDNVIGADGSSFGDRELSRGNRILRFMDDAESGALDILRVQSPEVFASYVQEYRDDIANSPIVRG